jgi:gamma-glutamylcyclotransferase (GGCT)/AIG2-like uncharacterized protein YtfP
MKKGDLLFVYGTLRPGERADLNRSRHEFGVAYIGEDDIVGNIYDTGCGYPGLKLEGDNKVHGDVFRVRDESVGPFLDAYEGYPSLYGRTQVETSNGRTVWVYTFNPPVKAERLIVGGDWCLRHETPPVPIQTQVQA